MSLKVSAEDIIPCIHRFLLKTGHTAAAKALEKSAEVEPRGGISTKKLLKIAKFYLKHHPELVAKEESEEESEEEVKPVKAKKAEKTVNGKRKPTKEESEEESEEEKPVKDSKKKIKTEKASGSRKQSKTIEEESEEEEEETTKKSQKNKVAPIKEKSAAKAAVVDEEENEEDGDNHVGRFSYVDHSVLNNVPFHLQDNTFQSKTLYGQGGDAFGQFGHERLIHTRGKGFTKEKNKLKNKQFHGGDGRINAHVTNSIKLCYSDDE
jgi:outer membrane biosynthesis protein TonB